MAKQRAAIANPTRFFLLLLIFYHSWTSQISGVAAEGHHQHHATPCRRLDAAMRYNGKDYLFLGPDYVKLNEESEEAEIHNKDAGWGLPRIDAALVYAKDGYSYFFEGGNYYYYSAWRFRSYGPYPSSDFDEKLDIQDGVDAAATLGDRSYFFKCCNYVTYDKGEISERHSLKEAGVECDIDAALPLNEDELALIKYDDLWVLNRNGSAYGPLDANEVIRLKSFKLCGEDEDEGRTIVEEEEEIKEDEEEEEEEDEEEEEEEEEEEQKEIEEGEGGKEGEEGESEGEGDGDEEEEEEEEGEEEEEEEEEEDDGEGEIKKESSSSWNFWK